MKLTYRGISYDYNPPQAQVDEVVAVGQYRGSGLKLRKAQKQLSQQPGLDLKYRGVAYNTATPESVLAPAVATPVAVESVPVSAVAASAVASVDDKFRSLVMNYHRNVKQREQVMLSRVAVQVGLPEQYAYQYWNPIQGKINTAVAATYNRSHVAFS